MYTFDPAKANQLLDAAGYKDGDGDGMREDKSGKPIKLRLWARAESPESQKTGSLLASWLGDLGLKIQYQVMDDGIYYDSIWAYEGDTYSPDFDMYLWDWDGYADPGDTLASFITSQIENWNEPCWSNAEYDAAVDEANTTLDPEKRKELVWRAQQIFYEESPEIVTDYPDKLEAVNTAKWDGWTRMYGGTGAAFYTSYVRDSYMNLKPKAAAATAEDGGAGGLTIAVVAAVVLLAVIIVAWLLVRRRAGGRGGVAGQTAPGPSGGAPAPSRAASRPRRGPCPRAWPRRARRRRAPPGRPCCRPCPGTRRRRCSRRRAPARRPRPIGNVRRRHDAARSRSASAFRALAVARRPARPRRRARSRRRRRRPTRVLGRTIANSSPP